jgi:hypothetical protein
VETSPIAAELVFYAVAGIIDCKRFPARALAINIRAAACKDKKLRLIRLILGKMVKQKYSLSSDDGRNESPKSVLISSHREFE